jgi:hypothetical protein
MPWYDATCYIISLNGGESQVHVTSCGLVNDTVEIPRFYFEVL